MRSSCIAMAMLCAVGVFHGRAAAKPFDEPDRQSPGDAVIQQYLARETKKIEGKWLQGVKSLDDWQKLRVQYMKDYFYMLGLSPMPEKTPLHATITGTLHRDGYVIEMVHYQSRPRLYVTGNLYRPANIPAGQRLPAVLYVCGHSNMGRDGNKTAYQAHGQWFARHGYVCLILDSAELGEIGWTHHGTYKENRWWWHSRGYTPSGVECWNGIRGIDYLISRPDVDPERIAVTGISGGGAATHWIAAADQRVKIAMPVSGLADLTCYVSDRVINGHCDCMFLNNIFQWPWAQIPALIAPRPLLFTNSDADPIFPMDANERVVNRLERVYSLYGASDLVDAMVSIGGHAYRKDLRQAEYRFMNTYLKNDPRIVEDSERDLANRREKVFPVEPSKLRVFPNESDIAADQLNTTYDQRFVPVAKVSPPEAGQFAAWKQKLLGELRRVTFRYLPERVPPARFVGSPKAGAITVETEPGIEIEVAEAPKKAGQKKLLLWVQGPDEKESSLSTIDAGDDTEFYRCWPRGTGTTRWTRKNPPNYVERSLVLLGRTADTCRVWDVIGTARYLRAGRDGKVPIYVGGDGAAGVLAAYAALLEPEIDGVIVNRPPLSHIDPGAPQFLNVLRVCDVPDALGMLAPRPLLIRGVPADALSKTSAAYRSAAAAAKLKIER